MRTVRQWILDQIDEYGLMFDKEIYRVLETDLIEPNYVKLRKKAIEKMFREITEEINYSDDEHWLIFAFNAYICDEDGPYPWTGHAIVSVNALLKDFKEIPCLSKISLYTDDDLDELSCVEQAKIFYSYELKPEVHEVIGMCDYEKFRLLLNAYICDDTHESVQENIIIHILYWRMEYLVNKEMFGEFMQIDSYEEEKNRELSEDELYCELYNEISIYNELRRCYLSIVNSKPKSEGICSK